MFSFLKYIPLLFALIVTAPALAQSRTADSAEDDLTEILTTEKHGGATDREDYFHTILEYMWGTFIFDNDSPEDGFVEVTVLSKVAGFVNVLALLLGIVITGYVGLGSVVNSASSGELLGKNWSTYWLPLRTAASFGLIIPTSAGAYTVSSAQVLVLKLIIVSSTAASFLWVKTVDELFQPQEPATMMAAAGYPYKAAYDISSMAFCSAASLYITSQSDARKTSFISVLRENGEFDLEGSRSSGRGSSMRRPTNVKIEDAVDNVSRNIYNVGDYYNESEGDDNLISSISFVDGRCGKIEFSLPKRQGSLTSDDTINPENNNTLIEQKRALIKAHQDLIMEHFLNVFEDANKLDMATYPPNLGGGETFEYGNGPHEFTEQYLDDFIDYFNKTMLDSSSVSYESSYVSDALHQFAYSNSGPRVGGIVHSTEKFINGYLKAVYESYDPDNLDSFSSSEAIVDRITQGGWVMAGGAFFRMSDIVSISSSSSSTMASTSPARARVSCDSLDDDSTACMNSKFLQSAGVLLDYYYQVGYGDFSIYQEKNRDNIEDFFDNVIYDDVDLESDLKDSLVESAISSRFYTAKSVINMSPTNALSTSDPESIIKDQSTSWAKFILSLLESMNFFGDDISQLPSSGSYSGPITFANANPYQDAVELGHGMVTLRTSMFVTAAVLQITVDTVNNIQGSAESSAVNILTGAGALTGVLFGAITGVINAFMPVLYVLIGLITAMAWTLAYYIPMMPVILWITLVAAYVLIVIEAVVATPLAVIMAATPEGEGIAGQRMESAIKMLASVLLRPSLMIIGLFASIFLAKIAYVLFIALFWPQATSYVGDGLFSTIATVVIYVSVLHQIISKSISVMDTLPSSILQWIGGGGDREFGQKSVDSMGQTTGEGAKGIDEASKEVARNTSRKREEQRRRKEYDKLKR